MSRTIACPIADLQDNFVVLPDTWLGYHAKRRDEAVKVSADKGYSLTLAQFFVALCLCETWHLDHIDGPPEAWNLEEVRLDLIAWVSDTVLEDFGAMLLVPKNSSGQ